MPHCQRYPGFGRVQIFVPVHVPRLTRGRYPRGFPYPCRSLPFKPCKMLATITVMSVSSWLRVTWSSDFRGVQSRNVTVIASGHLKSDSQCVCVNTALRPRPCLASYSGLPSVVQKLSNFFPACTGKKGTKSEASSTATTLGG